MEVVVTRVSDTEVTINGTSYRKTTSRAERKLSRKEYMKGYRVTARAELLALRKLAAEVKAAAPAQNTNAQLDTSSVPENVT